MKKRIGDVYSCKVKHGVRCFQYVCDDSSQLDSQVIAVFKRIFADDAEVQTCNFSGEDIEFYAHVFISFGLKQGIWGKVLNCAAAYPSEVVFRDTSDYGKPGITSSDDWWLWRINCKREHVGALVGEARNSFIGVVMAPQNILARLDCGRYSYSYPIPGGDDAYLE